MTVYLKAPAARVTYAHDWGARYLDRHSIVASQWRIEPEEADGVEIIEQAREGGVTSAIIAGGRPGAIYDLVNRIELSNGEIDERSISFRVEAR
jgi:hypothetical protein